MDLGILTFVNTTNYGAALQAYALQQVMEKEGHTCEIIDYTCEQVDKMHNPKKAALKPGVKLLLYPYLRVSLQKRYDQFMQFKKEHCKFSAPCNKTTIASVANKYDRIIVGSDQVWNTEITGDDRSFFLDFLDDDKKKFSYAASIGTSYFTERVPEYESLVSRFQAISVREKETADQLRKSVGRADVCVDVDPTLLNYRNWNAFITNDNPYGAYIFLYFLPSDRSLYNKIRKFANDHGCKLILLTKSARKERGVRSIHTAFPSEFLNLIAHAQYVIAGSFHALCFSLIFQKEFYAVPSPQTHRSGRLTDLLNTFGLDNRFVAQPEYRFVEEKIDYAAVDQKLEAAAEASMHTIHRICAEE